MDGPVPARDLAVSRRCVAAASGLLAATVDVTLSNFYGGLIAAVLTPVAAGAYWLGASRREPGSTRRLVPSRSRPSAALAVVVLVYVVLAHRLVGRRRCASHRGLRPAQTCSAYSATWWSYLVPPLAQPRARPARRARMELPPASSDGRLEQQVSLGWGSGRARPRRDLRPGSSRGPRPGSLAAVPRSSGPSPWPSRRLLPLARRVQLVPSPSSARPPSSTQIAPMFRSFARFGVIVQLMAALLAGIGAERPLGRRGKRGTRACLRGGGDPRVLGEYAI